jgi:hypothetical protein
MIEEIIPRETVESGCGEVLRPDSSGVPEVVKVELGSVSIQRVGSKVVSSSFQNPEGQVRPPKTKVSRGHPFSGVKLIG